MMRAACPRGTKPKAPKNTFGHSGLLQPGYIPRGAPSQPYPDPVRVVNRLFSSSQGCPSPPLPFPSGLSTNDPNSSPAFGTGFTGRVWNFPEIRAAVQVGSQPSLLVASVHSHLRTSLPRSGSGGGIFLLDVTHLLQGSNRGLQGCMKPPKLEQTGYLGACAHSEGSGGKQALLSLALPASCHSPRLPPHAQGHSQSPRTILFFGRLPLLLPACLPACRPCTPHVAAPKAVAIHRMESAACVR